MALRKAVRWSILVGVAVVIALVAVFAGVLVETGDEGSSDLEIYIGEQIRGTVNSYLKPQLEFTKPDYQYPKTVTIENVRITSRDPSRDGRVVDIIRIRRATLELGEIPEIGQPLLIERVRLEKPELRLLAIGPNDGSLIGFSDLLKESPEKADPATPSNSKLTDVLRIRLIQLVGGVISYDPRAPDGKVMELDNINTTLEIEPDESGWYGLRTKVMREPIFSATIDGRFNVNDAIAKISAVELKMELGEEANRTLPPDLQSIMDQYHIQGTLTLNASGEINFNDMMSSELNVEADLRDGLATFDNYRVKIDKFVLKSQMKNQAIKLDHFEVRAMKGVVFATGHLALTGEQQASIEFEAEAIDLSTLDRALVESELPKPDDKKEPSPLRGIVTAKFNLAAPLTAVMEKASGSGFVTLKDGRLVRVPVLQQLEAAVSAATDVFSKGKPSDQLHVEFKLEGDHALIQKLDMRTPSLAVRGGGTIGFDGKLDLSLNGGPLEKVQGLFGKIGEFTAKLTDELAKYRVTGTVEKPEFGIKVAPGLFN